MKHLNILAVGKGPIWISFILQLLQSGYSKSLINELNVEEITFDKDKVEEWRLVIKRYELIVYVSDDGAVEILRIIHNACKLEGTKFIPAIQVGKSGIVGPYVDGNFHGCWESAWRRIYIKTLNHTSPLLDHSSSAGAALMANVIVNDCVKLCTGTNELVLKQHLYMVDLESLQADVHSFEPHPLVDGRIHAEWLPTHLLEIEDEDEGAYKPDPFFAFLDRITSEKLGIIHTLDEGDLKQLPLSQCRIQVMDPLSDGPTDVMANIICSAFTHIEARREAGLTGIETYVSRLRHFVMQTLHNEKSNQTRLMEHHQFVGFGAGETLSEGVSRGLYECLNELMKQQAAHHSVLIRLMRLQSIEDKPCKYYWDVIGEIHGTPLIGLGECIYGFPVIYVSTGGNWFSSIGLNITLALRHVLIQVIQHNQNQWEHRGPLGVVNISLKPSITMTIPSLDNQTRFDLLQASRSILAQNHMKLDVFSLELEPFMNDKPARVWGTWLREEGVE